MSTPNIKPTPNDLLAQLAALQRENEQLKLKAAMNGPKSLTMRISAKGAVSVYGLGRFPVTLYSEPKEGQAQGQWQRLAEAMPNILKFIEVNAAAIRKARAAAASAPESEEAPASAL